MEDMIGPIDGNKYTHILNITFYEHNSRPNFRNILKAHKTNITPKTTLNYYNVLTMIYMTIRLGACYMILTGTPIC